MKLEFSITKQFRLFLKDMEKNHPILFYVLYWTFIISVWVLVLSLAFRIIHPV